MKLARWFSPNRAMLRPNTQPARTRLSVESLEARDNPSGGALDTTFGTNGQVNLSTNTMDMVNQSVVQTDGKIVNVGTVASNSSQLAVTRLNSDGTLDPTFGTGGAVKFTLGVQVYTVMSKASVALQPDGKIVVSAPVVYKSGGFFGAPNTEFVIGRLNANGALDTSFGNMHGWWISNPTKGYDDISKLAVVPNGTSFNIYAAGNTGNPSTFTVVKLNANGLPDMSYGTKGIASAPHLGASTTSNIPLGLAVSPAGEAFVVGGGYLAAFNPSGHLDTNFNSIGYVAVTAYNVALQGDKVLISGLFRTQTAGGPVNQGLVQRYTMTGTLDPTFSAAGSYLTPESLLPGTPSSLPLRGLEVEADGSIALLGIASYRDAGGVTHIAMALGHLSADGVADTSFGADGTGFVILPQYDNHYAYASWSLSRDLDGNYLVSGRYTPNGGADASTFQGTVVRFTHP